MRDSPEKYTAFSALFAHFDQNIPQGFPSIPTDNDNPFIVGIEDLKTTDYNPLFIVAKNNK